MLTLSRRPGEDVYIGKDIRVIVSSINKNQVKLGFEAPNDINIRRGELEERPEGNRYAPGAPPKAEKKNINVIVLADGAVVQNYLTESWDEASDLFEEIWQEGVSSKTWVNYTTDEVNKIIALGYCKFVDAGGVEVQIVTWEADKI